MKVEIVRYVRGGKNETTYYPILNYDIVTEKSEMLLVVKGDMHNDNDVKNDFYELFKVQFVASCMTAFSKEPLLVAFYLGEGGELTPSILSDLSGDYYPGGTTGFLIDYKSYKETCELTGETVISIIDYIKEVQSGHLGVNTFLSVDEKMMNYDEQKKYYSLAQTN